MSRGQDSMKKFCESLREHAMKVINFKKKKKVISKRALWIISKCKNLLYLLIKIWKQALERKKCCKVRDHCHYTGKYTGVAHSICNLK